MIKGHNIEVKNSRMRGIYLWLSGFPKIIDDIDRPLNSRDDGDPVFARAELPKKDLYFADNSRREYKDSRNIMLTIKENEGILNITQIPGIHDVTSPIEWDDTYDLFKHILVHGFRGNRYSNVALLGEKYMDKFSDFEYNPPEIHKKKTLSEKKDTRGDRYRLTIWTGFTENFVPNYIPNKKMSEGNILYAPVDSIEPFIVICGDLGEREIEERIAFYSNDLRDFKLPAPIRFLDSRYKEITPGLSTNTNCEDMLSHC